MPQRLGHFRYCCELSQFNEVQFFSTEKLVASHLRQTAIHTQLDAIHEA